MRARDRQTAEALRSVIAALENVEAVPTASHRSPVVMSEHVAGAAVGVGVGEASRLVLSPDDERALVAREVAELRSASATLAEAGRHERSAELAKAADTVEELLKG
jgi:hypothetical protein